MDGSFFDLPAEMVLKNTKTKKYPDGSTNTIYCSHYIWVDEKIVEQYKEELDALKQQKKAKAEKENQEKEQKKRNITKQTERERYDSIKRARDKCYDIARLNEWKYFITITFAGSEYDSKDPAFVMKKVHSFLRNKVQRDGLKYLLIPEYHKKGGIHCHALTNDNLTVTDSGTRLVYGFNKPVRIETIEQKGLKVRESPVGGIVYNIPNWKYGFSTAIEVDNSKAFAYYITKYITKGNKKIFGQYYWSSRNCSRTPEVIYSNSEFSEIERSVHSPPGGGYHYKYQANSLIVPNFEELSAKFDNISDFLDYVYSNEYKKEVEKYEHQTQKN